MSFINKSDIEFYKTTFENEILKKLKPKKQSKTVLLKKNQKYNSCPVDNKVTCKKHENNTKNMIKQKKEIIYHNHLPFEENIDCPLCVK